MFDASITYHLYDAFEDDVIEQVGDKINMLQ